MSTAPPTPSAPLNRALVNSEAAPLADARLAVTDDGVARGDGAFETIGVWDGRPFRLEDHIARLQESLRRILLPPADERALVADVEQIVDGVTDDAALRCYVTGSQTRVVTLSPPPDRVLLRRLAVQPAPWIQPSRDYGPAGAKTMSYGPNMTATRAAQRAGADDALLVSTDGIVLEGPTFCVLWVVDGVVTAAPVSRGIVDSISRRTLLELAAAEGLPTREAEVKLAEVLGADEVFACSSVRMPMAVERIEDHSFESPSPITQRLSSALEVARRGTMPR